MASQKLGKGFLLLLGGIVMFMLFFLALTWYAIRDVSEDWSRESRYVGIVGKKFRLNTPVFLVRQYETEYFKEGFRLHLDSSVIDSSVLQFLPETEVTFTSVEYAKRGVSGVEYIYLLGVIKNQKAEVFPFEYVWATPLFYHENEADKWKYEPNFWN